MRCSFLSIIKKKQFGVCCKEFVYVLKNVNKAKRLQLQFVRINMDFDFLTLTTGIQPKQPTLDIEITKKIGAWSWERNCNRGVRKMRVK